MFKTDNNKVVGDNNERINRTVMNLSKKKKSKKSTYMPNIGATKKPDFLTCKAKKLFNYL